MRKLVTQFRILNKIGGLPASRRQNPPRCRHTYQLYVQQVGRIISKKYDIHMTKIKRNVSESLSDMKLFYLQHSTRVFIASDGSH